jgi:hypothetical protein
MRGLATRGVIAERLALHQRHITAGTATAKVSMARGISAAGCDAPLAGEPDNRDTAAQASGSRVPSMAARATSVRRRLLLRA